jgi:hypothetical protein
MGWSRGGVSERGALTCSTAMTNPPTSGAPNGVAALAHRVLWGEAPEAQGTAGDGREDEAARWRTLWWGRGGEERVFKGEASADPSAPRTRQRGGRALPGGQIRRGGAGKSLLPCLRIGAVMGSGRKPGHARRARGAWKTRGQGRGPEGRPEFARRMKESVQRGRVWSRAWSLQDSRRRS